MAVISPTPSQLLGIAELAEFLKIPTSTLYAWRAHGVGPASIKVGRHLRYRREDVEAWLELQTRRVSGQA